MPTLTPFLIHSCNLHRDLHSFPTRRSSDLLHGVQRLPALRRHGDTRRRLRPRRLRTHGDAGPLRRQRRVPALTTEHCPDRKSTRLNSSHVEISYAVFCLKKKTLSTEAHLPN